ncbi:MAG TPA: LiaF domain-containing protein [Gemmatimonadaceae bacterium]|jgi:hypothetical protein
MADFKAEDYRLTDPLDPDRSRASDQRPIESEQLMPQSRSMSGVVSFLSSNERNGRWQLPRKFRVLAVMGNVEIDLREAEVGYGLSVIEAVSVLGNVEITVPPEIAVECDGSGLLGAFTLKYRGPTSAAAANREKTLRITGNAYAGNVEVVVKGPDEGALKKLGRTFRRRRQ